MSLEAVAREMELATREQLARLREKCAAPETVEARLGLAVAPGTRVLDLVTGQVGEVIGGGRANLVVPAARRAEG